MAHPAKIPLTFTLNEKKILLLLFFLLPLVVGAQLLYIDTMHVQELRGTTTLFVLPAEDSALRAEYEAAINAGWTFTPHRIVTAAEMAQYRDVPGYSFFLDFYMGLRPHNDPEIQGNLAVALAATFTRSAVEHAHDDKSLMRQTVAGDSMGLRRGYYLHCGLAMVLPEHEYKVFTPCAEIRMGRARDREEYLAALKTNAQHYHTAPLPPDPYWRNYMSPGLLKVCTCTYCLLLSPPAQIHGSFMHTQILSHSPPCTRIPFTYRNTSSRTCYR